jgi:chromosome segregation protein
MKLKYLTLYGFKSFPVRTRLQFSSGISAVVGPNGCGKSNVIDAIRWVLGEQSPAVLRAKGMEDLIYSGDRGRTVNFAEVTLGFETTGPLPVPELEGVTEVEIRRRLSRSGDSEYSINGRTCRLKDIHYLFMDTGTGNRAYSIVDQGQISRFVEMDAEERRDILNEAAGISRYKARRIETTRRLAQTKENLERLNDVLLEVNSQRKKLAEQAEHTSRYLKLREEQERLEKALYASEWQREQGRFQAVKGEMDEMRTQLAELESRHGVLVLERERLSIALLEKEGAIEALRNELSTKEEDLRQLLDLKNNQERLRFTEEHRLKTAQASIQEMEHRRQKAVMRLSNLQAEIVQIQQDLSRLASSIEKEENALESAQKTKNDSRDALEKLKGELVGTHAVYVRLDSQRRSQQAQAERLRAKLKVLESNRVAMEQETGLKDSELEQVQLRLSKLCQESEEIGLKEQAVRGVIEGLTSRRKEVMALRQELQTQLSELRARLKALQGLEEGRSGYLEATKALLQQKAIKNMGIVADTLQIQSGFEAQIETVFSDTLQAVVLDSMEDLEKARSLVKNNKMGDARVFVLKGLPQKTAHDDGPLNAVVAVTGPLQASLRAFLAQWDTALDIKTALEQVSRGQNNYFATEQGDVVTPWGEVILKGQRGSGIMVRRAEIAGLEMREGELATQYDAVVLEEKELQNQLDGAQKGLAVLRSHREQLAQEQNVLLRNLERMQAQAEARRERMERIALELEAAQSELLDIEIGLEETEQALEQAGLKRSQAEARIQEKESELRRQEEGLKIRQKTLEGQRIAMAERRMQLSSKEQELLNIEQRLQTMGREKESLEKGILEATKRINEIDKAFSATLQRLTLQEQEVLRIKASLTDSQKDYHNQRDSLQAVQKQVDSLQAQVQRLQKALHAKEVEAASVSQRIEAIVQRCQELFQSSVEEHQQSWLFDGFDSEFAQKRLKALSKEVSSIGAINLTAIEEFQRLEERYNFLLAQRQDLLNSVEDIEKAINQINRTCRQKLKETLELINERLKDVFPLLFEGGEATLDFTEKQDVLESGVEYLIKLPGKRIQHLSLLSGGEKALAALALIFAIFLMKPSPFCLLDEVDAPLDGANTQRFIQLVRRIAHQSQVLLITHNQRVMEIADTLYGVTMEEKGVSKLVSVRLSNEA